MKKSKRNLTKLAPTKTTLRFSPTAWSKLLFMRDAGDTEIGGFGIASADDLLFVEDIRLVHQIGTWCHVEFDDQSVADFFETEVDAGRRPEQFARIWIHTHPGESPAPSGTDEGTFKRVFGSANWAVMFILARGGQTYSRLRFNVGPGGEMLIPVEVDYGCDFSGSSRETWQTEFSTNVYAPPPEPTNPVVETSALRRLAQDAELVDEWWRDAWGAYTDFDLLPVEEPYGYIRDF